MCKSIKYKAYLSLMMCLSMWCWFKYKPLFRYKVAKLKAEYEKAMENYNAAEAGGEKGEGEGEHEEGWWKIW